MERCGWAGSEPIYVSYHDTDWGVPEHDSRALWEKLILDGFQAGLSWITILKKRDNFRTAFEGFDPHVIATWGDAEVGRLVQDAGVDFTDAAPGCFGAHRKGPRCRLGLSLRTGNWPS